MVKKLSRGQKAWVTRKANQLKASRKIATKIGIIKNAKKKHKIVEGLKEATKNDPWKVSETQIGKTLRIKLPNDFTISDGPKLYTPAPVLTLCGQLEDAIMLLEVRISNSIAKINSLM
jgi:hypothetical protein